MNRVKYTDHKWNWDKLSCNPHITWDIIQSYPDKPWSWLEISMNTNITWDIVESNTNKPWNWEGLAGNQTLRGISCKKTQSNHGIGIT